MDFARQLWEQLQETIRQQMEADERERRRWYAEEYNLVARETQSRLPVRMPKAHESDAEEMSQQRRPVDLEAGTSGRLATARETNLLSEQRFREGTRAPEEDTETVALDIYKRHALTEDQWLTQAENIIYGMLDAAYTDCSNALFPDTLVQQLGIPDKRTESDRYSEYHTTTSVVEVRSNLIPGDEGDGNNVFYAPATEEHTALTSGVIVGCTIEDVIVAETPSATTDDDEQEDIDSSAAYVSLVVERVGGGKSTLLAPPTSALLRPTVVPSVIDNVLHQTPAPVLDLLLCERYAFLDQALSVDTDCNDTVVFWTRGIMAFCAMLKFLYESDVDRTTRGKILDAIRRHDGKHYRLEVGASKRIREHTLTACMPVELRKTYLRFEHYRDESWGDHPGWRCRVRLSMSYI